MHDYYFYALTAQEVSAIKVSFLCGNESYGIHDPITLKHEAFGCALTIIVSQSDHYRLIEIQSDNPTTASHLWAVLLDVVRLCMLFDGKFLQFNTGKFYLEGAKTAWSDILFQEYNKRMLTFYSSADFSMKESDFASPLVYLSSSLFNNWIDIEDKLDIVHTMALYGMSSANIPIDLKAVFIIEAFEPLYDLIRLYNPEFKRISKNKRNDSFLRRVLVEVIKEYGQDVFKSEMQKDINLFCRVLKNSRNRIFHIKTNQRELYLSGEESVLYAAKLSMLYRRILLDLLGIKYDDYSDKLKEIVNKWNSWEGVLKLFLATDWNDSEQ